MAQESFIQCRLHDEVHCGLFMWEGLGLYNAMDSLIEKF